MKENEFSLTFFKKINRGGFFFAFGFLFIENALLLANTISIMNEKEKFMLFVCLSSFFLLRKIQFISTDSIFFFLFIRVYLYSQV